MTICRYTMTTNLCALWVDFLISKILGFWLLFVKACIKTIVLLHHVTNSSLGIGRFRGGAERAVAPLFSRISKCFTILLENRFIKCSLILSSKTLTLLYFTSQIRPQCCMLQVLKSEVFIQSGVGWGTQPPLSEFSGSAPARW